MIGASAAGDEGAGCDDHHLRSQDSQMTDDRAAALTTHKQTLSWDHINGGACFLFPSSSMTPRAPCIPAPARQPPPAPSAGTPHPGSSTHEPVPVRTEVTLVACPCPSKPRTPTSLPLAGVAYPRALTRKPQAFIESRAHRPARFPPQQLPPPPPPPPQQQQQPPPRPRPRRHRCAQHPPYLAPFAA